MFVNREKILIHRQSSEDSSESLKPLLNSDEESYVQSSTTYSSITSTSSASTSPGVVAVRRRKASDQTLDNLQLMRSVQPKLSLPSPPVSSPLALTFSPDRDAPPLIIETKAVVHNT